MPRGYPDFEGDKSGLYLKPEWAAHEGTDKTLSCENDNADWAEFAINIYNVPAGKTLYITGFSCQSHPNDQLNYDHFFYAEVAISVAAVVRAVLAGLGGCGLPLPKPIVATAGQAFVIIVVNRANENCYISATAWGYEV